MTRARTWGVIALAMAASAALVFSVSGVFDLRGDSATYAGQIESYAAGTTWWSNHLDYRLLYPVIGGVILHTTHPYAFILATNLTLYALLGAASFLLLRALGFREHAATVGTLWIISAYPVLKYGLALETDMAGWALSAVTLLVGIVALSRDSIWLLLAASIIGMVGCAARETGAAGLLTVFLLVLWRGRVRGVRVLSARLAALVLPAALLYAIVFIPRAAHGSIVVDWIDWIQHNRVAAAQSGDQSWLTWIGVEASTFGVCWLGAAYTMVRVARGRHVQALDVVAAAFVATLPALIWPFFVSRVLFIQFLWIMPLALGAYAHLRDRYESAPPGRRRLVTGTAAVAPIALNVMLFFVSRGRSLFDVLAGWR